MTGSGESSERGRGTRLSWWKKLVFAVFAVACGLMALFLAGEIACRLIRPQVGDGGLPDQELELLDYSDDIYLGWELKRTLPGEGHNAAGFRGREYDKEKPEGTWRIATIGDSVTYGLGVKASEAWPNVLEAKLSWQVDEPVEVLNFGVPGYNPFQELMLLKQKVVSYEPDLVVMMFTSDDVVTTPVIIKIGDEYVLFWNHLGGSWFGGATHWAIFKRSYFYRYLYMKFVVTFLIDYDPGYLGTYAKPEQQWKAVEAMAMFCRQEDFDFFLVFSPVLPPLVGPDPEVWLVNQLRNEFGTVEDLVEASGIEHLNLKEIYMRHNGKLKVAPTDFHHLNPEGCLLVAEEIAKKLLERKSGSSE